MSSIVGFVSKNKTLFLIFLLALFFRLYKIVQSYNFDHDQDLYSWIVKDILEGHFRLIGQLTSIEGVFIGPLFYYLLAPIYFVMGMNPLSALVLAITISLVTVISTYFLFKKLFGDKVGIVGGIIMASSMGVSWFDRWVVPTQPTILWSVWFLYGILSLLSGQRNAVLILAVLVGLVWHIHVALAPLVLIIPLAFLISDKKKLFEDRDGFLKTLAVSFAAIAFLAMPFLLFELKNGFIQTRSLLEISSPELARITGQPTGMYRAQIIWENLGRWLNNIIFAGYPKDYSNVVKIGFFASLSFLAFKKVISVKIFVLILTWISIVFMAQYLSKKGVSEYYFANLSAPLILVLSLLFGLFWKKLKTFLLVPLLLSAYVIYNILQWVQMPDLGNNYLSKLKTAEYIKQDAMTSGLPCVGLSFIADLGTNVGFRYIFWYKDLKVIKPKEGAHIYTIVFPNSRNKEEQVAQFGAYGVILPKERGTMDPLICERADYQLDPLLGFYN